MLLLFIYLINLYIRPQDWISFFYAWPVDYFIIIPALFAGILILSQDKDKLVSNPIYKFLFALLLIIFISNAIHGELSFGLDQFIKFFKKACIFIMLLLLVKSAKNLKATMFFIVLLSSFIAYQAIAQFISGGAGLAGQDFYHSGEGVRTKWVGLWNGANIMALLLNTSIPFALEFAFGPYTVFWRITNFIMVALLIGGVYTTNSRGGFLTLLVILLFYPILRFRRKFLAIAFGVFLAGLMFIYLSPTRTSQFDTQEESAHIRTRLWGSAIEMFKNNPVLGVGTGQFIHNDENSRGMVAHSNFMQNLAETGGIGIFVWAGLIYFAFLSLLDINKINGPPGSKEDKLKSLGRALIVSMVGFNVCTLFITMEIDIFYLLLGLCAVAVNVMNKEIQPVHIVFGIKDVKRICAIVVAMFGFYYYFTR